MLINTSTKLKHIIFSYPHSIVALNRFGIRMGVGNATVAETFKSEVDSNFFLLMLNTYLFEDYFPEDEILEYPLSKIADYLKASSYDYTHAILPNVGRHLNSLAKVSADKDSLRLLQRFYDEMESELRGAIIYDEKFLMPLLNNSEDIKWKAEILVDKNMVGVCEEVEAKLDDLISFFVVHLQGIEEYNLCRAVVDALFTLKRDVSQNNKIRRHILLPLLKRYIGTDYDI